MPDGGVLDRARQGYVTGVCPCCGQATSPEDGFDGNTFWWKGKAAEFTAYECDIFQIIAIAEGKWVRDDTLIRGVWGLGEPADAEASLKVLIHRVRKKIAPLGLKIANDGNRNYRLEAE